ncbi:MAG: polysulfide reductase NrfD [Sulfurovum sp.]|nr:polysulfide reductase NrfD [Sulfurovum sp.]MCB4750262.1 polysulfide reductase NrfD [Sulfurovum sp.]MCB4753605.1 polysulfide reductase NrfD [Sulfurovum sp.]MCB4754200.1 polysulfide reductase NrfD [Sulfurovum sp.]MCB4758348.1 polysulfide reductase NrfD [Sulfurovum sp.]
MDSAIHATQAVVTLDVALPGIIWGWMITLNMWAKSVGTGVILVGAFLLYRHKKEEMPNLRWLMPLISFVFLNIFLLFTLTDLHQPYRMINIFLHPHWTSAITVGAWMASLFTALITVMMVIGFFDAHPDVRKNCILAKTARANSQFYEKIFPFVVFLAIPVTLYTAIIMAESSARELWQAPAEVMQMMWAALLAGSAALILTSKNWSKETRKDLALVLAIATFFSFLMYMGEYFFSFKSSEAEATLAYVHLGGKYNVEFWFGMVLGFIVPFLLSVSNMKSDNKTLLRFSAVLALIGLYMAKDVWLKIPQMLPLS